MRARSDVAPSDRLVFLHGFTQTHHHWHPLAFRISRLLGSTPDLVLPDLPGHGLSASDGTPFDAAAIALTALCGYGTYIGYSMGGRLALAAAHARPNAVERLVLIGATAGIESDAERAERRRLDDERARRIEKVGVTAFLDEWIAMPMFTSLPHDSDSIAHRERNTAAGLALSLRTAGTGSQPDLWPSLDTIDVPTLVVSGERDEKFSAIGRRLADALPHADFVAIERAGHAAHIERPAATALAIADWLTVAR